MAGADAVQVGTATFRDPRAPWKVLGQLARWCGERDISVEGLRAAARRCAADERVEEAMGAQPQALPWNGGNHG